MKKKKKKCGEFNLTRFFIFFYFFIMIHKKYTEKKKKTKNSFVYERKIQAEKKKSSAWSFHSHNWAPASNPFPCSA